MKFLVDAQLPPALAELLATSGHEARHVGEVGLRNAEDLPIWQYALATESVLITKDVDFVARSRQGGDGPCVVWLRLGNASNRALRAWLTPLLPGIVAMIEDGEKLIEVR